MKTKITILALLINFLAIAQDGTLDTTFGTGGKVDYSIYSSFMDMQIDYENSKIVAIGKNLQDAPIIVRYNLDGTLDTTFDSDGIKVINFGNATETPASLSIYDYESSSFGYLVTSSLNGKIAKIKSDGTYDASFGTNGIYTYNTFVYDNFHNVVINYDYSNGNIVFASYDTQIFTGRINLYKITPNGGNVSTFNGGNPVPLFIYTGQDISPNSLNTDDNGNIYISGGYSIAGGYDTTVRKFSSSGVLDSSYTAQAGGSSARSYSYPGLVFDGGESTTYNYGMDQNYKMIVAKRTSTGTADATFGTNGITLVDFTDTYYDNVKSVTGHEFGSSFKIILVGRTRVQSTTAISNISLARINDNGTLDTTFGTAGKVSIPTSFSSYTNFLFSGVDSENGKLYVMGFSASNIVSLYRFNLSSILSTQDFNNTKSKIIIYPNPTNNFVIIQNRQNSTENFEYKIVDLTGRIVKSGNSKYNEQINIESLTSGNYIFQIETEKGEKFTEKLLKN